MNRKHVRLLVYMVHTVLLTIVIYDIVYRSGSTSSENFIKGLHDRSPASRKLGNIDFEVDPEVEQLLHLNYPPSLVNTLLDSTLLGIVSDNRPKCLARVLRALSGKYPNLQILIIDRGEEHSWRASVKWLQIQTQNSSNDRKNQVYRVPSNSSIASCKDELLRHARLQNFQYIILIDENFEEATDGLIEKLLAVMIESKVDIVAATDISAGYSMTNTLLFSNKTLYTIPNVTYTHHSSTDTVPPIPVSKAFNCEPDEMLSTFLLMNLASFNSTLWDDQLFSFEHYDFLLQLRHRDIRVLSCKSLFYKNIDSECHNAHKEHPSNKRRALEWLAGAPKFFEKYGIRRLEDMNGRSYAVTGRSMAISLSVSNANETKAFLDFFNAFPENNSYMKFMSKFNGLREITPCVKLLLANTTASDTLVYRESCPWISQFWRLESIVNHKHHSHPTISPEPTAREFLVAEDTREILSDCQAVTDFLRERKASRDYANFPKIKNWRVSQCSRVYARDFGSIIYTGVVDSNHYDQKFEKQFFVISSSVCPVF